MNGIIALIPARAGSKRIPGKNLKLLAGQPLFNWTVQAARQSEIFEKIVISTDLDLEITNLWPDVQILKRPAEFAQDDSPDLEWVRHALHHIDGGDSFAILRPTSPFRTAATIQRAWAQFKDSSYHSLRAVQLVTEHPAKMWALDTSVYGGLITPLIGDQMNLPAGTVPMHSCPTQILPRVYVQNASLEMAYRRTVTAMHSISGTKIGPFLTEGAEGFDLNTLDDWAYAEYMIAEGRWVLPTI